MRATQMLCLLGCCRFYDGGSVVVDSLFNVPPIGLRGFCV